MSACTSVWDYLKIKGKLHNFSIRKYVYFFFKYIPTADKIIVECRKFEISS